MAAIAEPPPVADTPTPPPADTGTMDSFEDSFKDLDIVPDPPKPPPPAPKPSPTPSPTPKPETPPMPPAGKTPAKPVETPKPEAKTEPEPKDEDFEPPAVAKPGDLRGWALRMGKKAKEALAQAQQLQTELTQLKARPTAPATNGKQHEELTRQIADYKKRVEDYENDLRLTKYERSQEYRDKYQTPYDDAVSRAYAEVKELSVITPNPEDPEHPTERPATNQDFEEIYHMKLGQAAKVAKAKFGDAAGIVMSHRARIHELAESGMKAINEYKTKGGDLEKAAKLKEQQRNDFVAQGWEHANTAFISKNPEAFDNRDDDTEGNDLLVKGREFVDRFMSDEREQYPLPQQVMADARIRNWASAFLRDQRDLKKLKADLAAANQTIDELRGSGPGKPPTADDTVPGEAPTDSLGAFDQAKL